MVRVQGALLAQESGFSNSLQARAERGGRVHRTEGGAGSLAGREGPSGGGVSVTVASALSG